MGELVSQTTIDGLDSAEQCDRVVAERGGSYEPLSSNPGDVRMACVCKEGHRFTGTVRTILTGKWCRECRRHDELSEIASKLGWAVKADMKPSGRVFFKVLCGKGHEVPITEYKLRNTRAVICQKCTKDAFFEKRDRVCTERGGECLDEGYRTASTLLAWRCAEGHTFRAKMSEVVEDNQWCRRCERHADVREVAVGLGWTVRLISSPAGSESCNFLCAKGHKVVISKHKLLNRPDATCQVCKNETYFAERDRVCTERGGECLEKGYQSASTKLKWRCAKGHSFTAKMRDVVDDGKWCNKCEYYQEMVELARSQGWNLLSQKFIKKSTIYRWRCPSGHVVQKLAQRAFSCEKCGDGSEKLRLERVRKIAEEKSGTCLSTNCPKEGKHLSMACRNGHQWMTSFSSLVYGESWCPECSKTRTTLVDARKVAAARGGKCLSSECHDRKSVLVWECAEGHRFRKQYMGARRKNGWCSECKKAGKTFEAVPANQGYPAGCMKSPETMMKRLQKTAKDKGGACLSTEYKNLGPKMTFECAKGHRWEASPRNVIYRGSWCPSCATVRMTLGDLREKTKSSGARITSKTYRGSTATYDWVCDHGHVFTRSVKSVMKRGCPTCRKDRLQQATQLGASVGERPHAAGHL